MTVAVDVADATTCPTEPKIVSDWLKSFGGVHDSNCHDLGVEVADDPFRRKVCPLPVVKVPLFVVLAPDQVRLQVNVDPEVFACELGEILAPAA